MHRGKVYVQVIRSVNETLAAAHRHVEATKIQNSYKSYKERLMTQASLVAIINAIRESQRHVAAVTIQDAFRAKQMQIMMEEMEYQVQLLVDLNVRSMQRIVRGHLARVYVKNLKLQIIAAKKSRPIKPLHVRWIYLHAINSLCNISLRTHLATARSKCPRYAR